MARPPRDSKVRERELLEGVGSLLSGSAKPPLNRLALPPPEPMTVSSLAEIATGGMGSVHLARVENGRLAGHAVAIKRLHPNIAQDPQFVGMFLDEAWMTAALRSQNVVQVAAWGEDAQGMFLAVELVQGVSLARLIKESRANEEPFAERTVAFLGSQICAGLAAAHGLRGQDGKLLGLVHRDLTPGNVLVSFDGVVKIADFGIAKAEERITHTRTGTLKGKPAYMAPEQARATNVDHRADLFSFGVMMFELLAGRRPWLAKGTFEVMMEAAQAPTPDLTALRKNVNPMFARIVHRCLEKKAADRYDSAEQIRHELDAWRYSKGFVHDDQESLASFVRRNSTRQIAWFEQALRGDFARGGAPTFKELEDTIDHARRGGRRSSGVRPAAQSSPNALPPPPAAARPVPPPPPSAPSSSGRAALPRPPPSRPQLPPKPDLDFSGGATVALGSTTSDLDRTVALDRRGPDPNDAATILDPRLLGRRTPLGGTVAIPPPELPAIGGGTEPLSPSPFARGAIPAPPDGRPGAVAVPSGGMVAPPDSNPRAIAPAPKRSRAGLVVLLSIPIVLGVAFVGWRFRHRVLGSAAPQTSAPIAPPTSSR